MESKHPPALLTQGFHRVRKSNGSAVILPAFSRQSIQLRSSQQDNQTIVRRFQRRCSCARPPVPQGRLKFILKIRVSQALFQPSLRDLVFLRFYPGIKMPGYCHRVAPRRPKAPCPDCPIPK
jgi:hypothetical protein